MKTVIPITIAMIFLLGCSETPTKMVSDETPPVKHVQKSTELQTVMRKFDNLIYQHYQSELDRDRKRIDYTKDMIEIVDELVINSKTLKTLPHRSLTEEESKGFLIFANELEVKSEKLKEIVLSYKTEEIAPTLDEIINICMKCHDTLR